MRESKEFIKSKEEEKSIKDELERIKKEEEIRAKEDKTGTPWNLINPDLVTPENLEIFQHYLNGELEVAHGEVEVAKAKLEKMKGEQKETNEALLLWLDDKIVAEIARKELEEQKAKDNY